MSQAKAAKAGTDGLFGLDSPAKAAQVKKNCGEPRQAIPFPDCAQQGEVSARTK
jgi:hypothetical protein